MIKAKGIAIESPQAKLAPFYLKEEILKIMML
jgi:hypothetical protein